MTDRPVRFSMKNFDPDKCFKCGKKFLRGETIQLNPPRHPLKANGECALHPYDDW